MEFPSVPDLKIDDNFFDYKNTRYLYEDLASIDFGATITKHRVNFVPAGTSYEAKLTVQTASNHSFEIKPKKRFFGGLKEEAFRELQRVSAALSFMSFNFRLARYENNIESHGLFKMGGFEFHKNGDLSQKGRFITNLKDGSHNFLMGAFTVTISKKKKSLTDRLKASWSGESTIYIGSDRDCFIYLLKQLYGLSWPNEQIPKKRVDTKKIYYETVVRLGAWLSSVDGNTDPRELAQLKKYFKIDSETFPTGSQVFNEQLTKPQNIEKILKSFIVVFENGSEVREALYVGLLSVALADGIFHPKEKNALNQLSHLLGFDLSRLTRIYASVGLNYNQEFGEDFKNSGSGGRNTDTKNNASIREQHLKVLGLSSNATDEEIRLTYTKLVKRYHPDILRSKGLPENEMRHAQTILRKVMEAYEYLKSGS